VERLSHSWQTGSYQPYQWYFSAGFRQFVLPWMIGRLGCALAYDHRGFASTSWIAVNFPEGPRYDLGLIEFLFLIVMGIGFKLLDRRPRQVGFFVGLYGVVYGGFRIWLDTLRQQPNGFYGGIS
jgi:prolipoprotein diacylglyceryltransferase